MFHLWISDLCSITMSSEDPLGLSNWYPNGYWLVRKVPQAQLYRWYEMDELRE